MINMCAMSWDLRQDREVMRGHLSHQAVPMSSQPLILAQADSSELTASDLSGPYRAMRGAMRCERRCVLNTKWRCDAIQNSRRCAFSLRRSSAMRSRDAKTLAMRCCDAGHSASDRGSSQVALCETILHMLLPQAHCDAT